MTHQDTLYPFRRWEAYLWAVAGLVGAWFVQITGCLDQGIPCTWQRLTLSTVAGVVLGLIVWILHFPLRWWMLAAAAYYYVTLEWATLTGNAWPYHLAAEHHPLWMACGVAGAFFYSRWLAWKYYDYTEQLTIYLCFYGAFLGAPILLVGLWYFFRRWREKAAWEALEGERMVRQAEFYKRLQDAIPSIYRGGDSR